MIQSQSVMLEHQISVFKKYLGDVLDRATGKELYRKTIPTPVDSTDIILPGQQLGERLIPATFQFFTPRFMEMRRADFQHGEHNIYGRTVKLGALAFDIITNVLPVIVGMSSPEASRLFLLGYIPGKILSNAMSIMALDIYTFSRLRRKFIDEEVWD